jgi:predicted transcriptional regulator
MRIMNPQDVLHDLVERHGSQQAVSRVLGLGQSYISDLLSGRRAASNAVLDKIGLQRIIVRAPAKSKRGRPPLSR